MTVLPWGLPESVAILNRLRNLAFQDLFPYDIIALKFAAVKGANHVHTAAHRGREKPLAPGKQVQCVKIVDCGV